MALNLVGEKDQGQGKQDADSLTINMQCQIRASSLRDEISLLTDMLMLWMGSLLSKLKATDPVMCSPSINVGICFDNNPLPCNLSVIQGFPFLSDKLYECSVRTTTGGV